MLEKFLAETFSPVLVLGRDGRGPFARVAEAVNALRGAGFAELKVCASGGKAWLAVPVKIGNYPTHCDIS